MENSRKHNDNSGLSNLVDFVTIQNELASSESDTISNTTNAGPPEIVLVEPFYSGSHKQLIDLLYQYLGQSRLITLSGKKWPWRARCSSLILSAHIPRVSTEKILFCSSVLSLAELLGLRPDLQPLRKIVYFHENQFVYPIRQIKERDVQFAYNQITTCLAADEIVFNSEFNLKSLLENLNRVVALLPDYRPRDLQLKIQPKCRVLYFPVEYPIKQLHCSGADRNSRDCLTIVWPHRWEFDKDPGAFINILSILKEKRLRFRVHLLGGHFVDIPDILNDAREALKENIVTFGFVEDKKEYHMILLESDVVVSTAIHEFFGVSVLEATYCGCFPIVPNKLVYPEIYPTQCLYNDQDDAVTMLEEYCRFPMKAARDHACLNMDFQRYASSTLLPYYAKLFE